MGDEQWHSSTPSPEVQQQMGPCSWRTGQQPGLHPDHASTGDGMRAPAWWPWGGSGSAKLGGAQLSPGTPVSTQPSLPPAGEVTSLPSSLEGRGGCPVPEHLGWSTGRGKRHPLGTVAISSHPHPCLSPPAGTPSSPLLEPGVEP